MDTKADVTLEKQGEGFAITTVHLTLRAKIPGTTDAKFQEIAGKAKAGCPVSKLLKADITLDAKLEAEAAFIRISPNRGELEALLPLLGFLLLQPLPVAFALRLTSWPCTRLGPVSSNFPACCARRRVGLAPHLVRSPFAPLKCANVTRTEPR